MRRYSLILRLRTSSCSEPECLPHSGIGSSNKAATRQGFASKRRHFADRRDTDLSAARTLS